jgi:hypothetical protein
MLHPLVKYSSNTSAGTYVWDEEDQCRRLSTDRRSFSMSSTLLAFLIFLVSCSSNGTDWPESTSGHISNGENPQDCGFLNGVARCTTKRSSRATAYERTVDSKRKNPGAKADGAKKTAAGYF